MKKFLSVLGVLLVAALVCLSGPARGEVYVEAYLGGVFGANAGATLTASGTHPDPVVKNTASFDIPGRLDPAFQGGHKLGTWFVKENHANVWIAPKRDFAILICINQGGDEALRASDEAVAALIQQRNSRP